MNNNIIMDNKKFTLWNRLVAAFVFVVAAVTYLLTIEPDRKSTRLNSSHAT